MDIELGYANFLVLPKWKETRYLLKRGSPLAYTLEHDFFLLDHL